MHPIYGVMFTVINRICDNTAKMCDNRKCLWSVNKKSIRAKIMLIVCNSELNFTIFLTFEDQ